MSNQTPGSPAPESADDSVLKILVKKLTSEVLIFLLAYALVVFAVVPRVNPEIVSQLGYLLYLIPIVGSVAYVSLTWPRKRATRGDKVGGDQITGIVSSTSTGAQVAVGKEIQQSITPSAQPLTSDERAEVDRLLARLEEELARQKIPEEKKSSGQAFLKLLRKELTRTDAAPDTSTVKVAGSELLDNVPTLTGVLTSLFTTPAVKKLVVASGDLVADWVKTHPGHAG